MGYGVGQHTPTPKQFFGFIRSAASLETAEARIRRGKPGTLKLLEQLRLPQVITENTLKQLEEAGYEDAVEVIREQTDWFDRS